MTTVGRRAFLGLTAAAAVMADSAKVEAAKARAAGLSSITTGVQPISAQEHSARLAKVQTAMQQRKTAALLVDRKSTRLNSSHSQISYAVFCLKKKTKDNSQSTQNIYHTVT